MNALVDPDEVSARLPQGARPHVTELGTVVGCCLLEIDGLRPSALPPPAGVRLRAAAHRISVEWHDESGETVVGVYVPMRLTDSRLAVMLGGRLFPGVHRRARLQVDASARRLFWVVGGIDDRNEFDLRIAVSKQPHGALDLTHEVVGTTCLGATVGLSPNRIGALEAVIMRPESRAAAAVRIDDFRSAFLDRFVTARPAPAFLMQDVGVMWHPGHDPALTSTHGAQ